MKRAGAIVQCSAFNLQYKEMTRKEGRREAGRDGGRKKRKRGEMEEEREREKRKTKDKAGEARKAYQLKNL